MTDTTDTHDRTSAPTDEAPAADAHRCPHCGRPFASEQWRALHLGLAHDDRLDEAEREAFRDAYETEQADLRLFRLQALAVLVLLYFGFLIVYAVVT